MIFKREFKTHIDNTCYVGTVVFDSKTGYAHVRIVKTFVTLLDEVIYVRHFSKQDDDTVALEDLRNAWNYRIKQIAAVLNQTAIIAEHSIYKGTE